MSSRAVYPEGPASNRRTEQRYELIETIIPVRLPDAMAVVTDISATGMGVQASSALKPGTRKTVLFAPPTANGPVQADCEIAWSDPLCRSGLQILHFHRSEHETAYTKWVKDCEALKSAPKASSADAASAEDDALPRLETQKLFRRLPELEKLRDDLTRISDYHVALDSIVQRAVAVTHADGGAIALRGPDGIACRASFGSAPEIGARLNLSGGLSGACFQERCVVLCNSTLDDPRVDRAVCRQMKIHAALLAPVLSGGDCIGIIQVTSPSTGIFFERHAHLMRGMAEICAELYTTGNVCPPQTPPKAQEWKQTASQIMGGAKAAAAIADPPRATPAHAVTLATSMPAVERPPLRGVRVSQRTATATVLLVLAGFGGAAFWQWRSLTLHNSTPAIASAPTVIPQAAAAPVADQTTAMPSGAATAPAVAAHPTPRSTTPHLTSEVAPDVVRSLTSAHEAKSKPHAAAEFAQQHSLDATINTPGRMPSQILPRPQNAAAQSPAIVVNPLLVASMDAKLPDLASAAPEVTLGAVPVSRGITGGKLIHSEHPVYPAIAKQLHITGTVVVLAKVGASGHIKEARATSGPEQLRRVCEDSVKHWRYQPFMLDGAPVESTVTVSFRFR